MAAEPDSMTPRSTQAGEPENPNQSPGFEEGLAQLADIVSRLEGGGLGLAASIEAYERGVAMLGRLHAELTDAEQRVRVLLGVDEQGRPVLQAGFPSADSQPQADGAPARLNRPADRATSASDAAGEPSQPQPASGRKAGGGRAAAGRPAEPAAGKAPRSRSLPGMDAP